MISGGVSRMLYIPLQGSCNAMINMKWKSEIEDEEELPEVGSDVGIPNI